MLQIVTQLDTQKAVKLWHHWLRKFNL